MKLHVLGLPHTEVSESYLTCAYTMKILKFGEMMTDAGHDVIIYAAGDTTEAVCTEYVPLLSTAERLLFYGADADDPNTTWGHVTWDPATPQWSLMNERAVREITARAGSDDLVLLSSGASQRTIADQLHWLVSCEPFVGYEGITLPFCAFESHAWRHWVYGKYGISDGRWYDAVIPNYFVDGDFHLADKKDYLLYIGRLIYRKGVLTAHQLAKASGMKLVVAGPGARSFHNGTLETLDGMVLDNVDYRGPVGQVERGVLMAEASALLAPTTYVEPFGGVTIEGMLSGTPAITTEWGAYSETVENGVTGFRFHTLADGVRAVRSAVELDPGHVRGRAVERFSLPAVAKQFTAWFTRLQGLYGDGWPTLPEEL